MLTIGTREQFQRLREFLRTRYSEEIVSAALGVPRIAEFDKRDPHAPIRDTIVRFFFGGAALPLLEFHRSVPPNTFDVLAALGLIEREGDAVWCPFIVYPTRGLHMVSDRFMRPDGTPAAADREFVYFALTANTQAYLDMLPDGPCASFLDMGGGCGAAALVQARLAQRSCAADISPRSTLFATFNALLNNLDNMEAVEGSLYEPLHGRTFERIGCHPPYDLSSSSPWTFADGGGDGEFVIRGTIAGLPDHLAPGGEFYALFRGADRRNRPLEYRVREWLGDRNPEFDIALVVRAIVGVEDYAVSSILSTSRDFGLYESYMNRFAELEVEQLAYSSLLVRRKTQTATPVTVRRTIGERCTFSELRWLLDWESASPSLELSEFDVVVSPALELVVRHKALHGDMRPVEYTLRATNPFSGELQCPEWIAVLLSCCVERTSLTEAYTKVREHGPITPDQFEGAVKRLVSLGALQLASGKSMTSSS